MNRVWALVLAMCMSCLLAACETNNPQPVAAESQQQDSIPVLSTDMEVLLASPKQSLINLLPADAREKYSQLAENIIIERTTEEQPQYRAVIEYYSQDETDALVEKLIEQYKGEKAEMAAWNDKAKIFKTEGGYVEVTPHKQHTSVIRINFNLQSNEELAAGFDKLIGLTSVPVIRQADEQISPSEQDDKESQEEESAKLEKTAQRLRYEDDVNLFSFADVYHAPEDMLESLEMDKLGKPKGGNQGYKSIITPEGLLTLTTSQLGEMAELEAALKKSCWLSLEEAKTSKFAYEFYKNPQAKFESALDKRIIDLLTLNKEGWKISEVNNGQSIYSAGITFKDTGTDFSSWAATISEMLKTELKMEKSGVYSAGTKFGWIYLDVRMAPERAELGFNRPLTEGEQSFDGFARRPSAAFTAVPQPLEGQEQEKTVSYNKDDKALTWSSIYAPVDGAAYQQAAEFFVTELSKLDSFVLTENLPPEAQKEEEKEDEPEDGQDNQEDKTDSKDQQPKQYSTKGLTITATNQSIFTQVVISQSEDGYICKIFNTLYLY